MFQITVKGKAIRFSTLEAAKKCAQTIFNKTGVIVGIDEVMITPKTKRNQDVSDSRRAREIYFESRCKRVAEFGKGALISFRAEMGFYGITSFWRVGKTLANGRIRLHLDSFTCAQNGTPHHFYDANPDELAVSATRAMRRAYLAEQTAIIRAKLESR